MYPELEPYDHGLLDAGDGQRVYWEQCGNPAGKPAVVLHGGPGSGCTPWQRRLFDPARYRVVLLDQRGAGRSTPHASEPGIDLSTNTTQHLIGDIEAVRKQLGIDAWLVLGGSWGSTLALAYAERHPKRVTELVLHGVAAGRWSEHEWLFGDGLQPLFPAQWARRRAALPEELQGDVIAGYRQLLHDPDPAVCARAAYEWCLWESATPDWPPRDGLASRFTDPRFALGFARLVTWYVHHHEFLEDGAVFRDIAALAGIPGVLIDGRFDLQSPIGTAWELAQAWPDAELVVVEDAGHSGSAPGIAAELLRATDRFAVRDLTNRRA